MNRPPVLRRGDRIGLIAPGAAVCGVQAGADAVRDLGLEPVVFPGCCSKDGVYAGTDAQRASEWIRSLTDRTLKGVWCARGGYGAQRLLPLLRAAKLKDHTKYFLGYSDVTALHLFLTQRCGWMTCHTPMPASELSCGLDAWSRSELEALLFDSAPREISNPPEYPLHCIRGGCAQGALTGGNLSVLTSLCGTRWSLKADKKILFLEDVGEKAERVDRMLWQLDACGLLSECAGVILGSWKDCAGDVDGVLERWFSHRPYPVLSRLCCGHGLPTQSVWLGMHTIVDGDGMRIYQGE